MDAERKPIDKYLQSLERELRLREVGAWQEALSDAQEFLRDEARSLAVRKPQLADDERYAHFVKTFGTPAQVAQGYVEWVGGELEHHSSRTRGLLKFAALVAGALLLCATGVGITIAALLQEPPKLSPFTDVSYEGQRVIVGCQGKTYELLELENMPIAEILRHTQETYGDLWQKRFAEDLVEVLWSMDHRPGDTVRLRLCDPKNRQIKRVLDAAMTEANRRAIWHSRNRELLMRVGTEKYMRIPKLSPFTEVRYDEEKVIVRYDKKHYEFLAIDNLQVPDLVRYAQKTYGRLWQKRIAEDLVEVLWGMDHRPGDTVKLTLRDPESGATMTIPKAPMTKANRRVIWHARQAAQQQRDASTDAPSIVR